MGEVEPPVVEDLPLQEGYANLSSGLKTFFRRTHTFLYSWAAYFGFLPCVEKKKCQWRAVSGNLVDSHWISGLLSRQNEASQAWWRVCEENMNQETVCVFVCDTASISRNVLLLQTKKHHKAYTTLSFLSQCHQTFFRRNRWTRFVCFLARKRLISLCGCVRKSNLTLFGENESMADKSTRTEEYEGQGWEKKKMRRNFFSSICKEVEMSTKEVEIQFCSTGSDKLVCFFFLNRKFSAQSLQRHNTDNNTVFMRKKRNNFFVTEADPEVVSPIHLQKTFCWGSCLMSSQKIDFNLEMWSLFPTFRLWITVFTNGPPHLRTI